MCESSREPDPGKEPLSGLTRGRPPDTPKHFLLPETIDQPGKYTPSVREIIRESRPRTMCETTLPLDLGGRQVAAVLARRDPPLEVVLRMEARNLAGVAVGFPVEEPHFLAVRQEYERHAELFGVVPALVLRRDRIGARPLGLQRRHGAALTVAEHIVGLRAVRKRVFEQHARTVGQVPARSLSAGRRS